MLRIFFNSFGECFCTNPIKILRREKDGGVFGVVTPNPLNRAWVKIISTLSSLPGPIWQAQKPLRSIGEPIAHFEHEKRKGWRISDGPGDLGFRLLHVEQQSNN